MCTVVLDAQLCFNMKEYDMIVLDAVLVCIIVRFSPHPSAFVPWLLHRHTNEAYFFPKDLQ